MNNQPFVAGNFEDKYHTKNPISKFLMQRFLNNFEELLAELKRSHIQIRSICEVGCGEGELLKILNRHFPQAELYACDIATSEIAKAKANTKDIKIKFSVQNAEKLTYSDKQFDLVVCCEVLEHLDHPCLGFLEISRIGKKAIISVPLEPLWRILNLIRFKYVKQLGNTPGHYNHWSKRSFLKMALRDASVLIAKMPLPWQMYLFKLK